MTTLHRSSSLASLLALVLSALVVCLPGGCGTDDDGAGTAASAEAGPTDDGGGVPADGGGAEASLEAGGDDAALSDAASGPTLTIADVAFAEGSAGTKTVTFNVTLSAASESTVTVAYATADGTATTASGAVGGADYAAASGTLSFAPGDTAKVISVQVTGDTVDEADETFSVTLSAPTNAAIGVGTATGTIQDDDDAPSLSVANVPVIEGNSGTVAATFHVTLSAVSGQSVSVQADTADGTATVADADYVAVSAQAVTFAPGETTKDVVVNVNGDTTIEPNETFTLNLSSPSHATLDVAQATATIQNDDGTTIPTISVADVQTSEGDSGAKIINVAVTLSASYASTVTVDFATSDGTARAAAPLVLPDYDAFAGTLSFAPGVVTKNIALAVLGDTVYENDETVTVTLTNPTNGNLLKATGTVTINNDDAAPVVSIAPVSRAEGRAGPGPILFAATLDKASEVQVTADYSTTDGTATSAGKDADFVAASGTVVFAPSVTSVKIPVTVNGDAVNEADETFTLTLANPSGGTLGALTSVAGTITNDDALPQLFVGDIDTLEGDTGSANVLKFPVLLSEASGRTVTVAYATGAGTATAGTDFEAVTGTLTFLPGETLKEVSVNVLGDVAVEGNEDVPLVLSSPTNAAIASAKGLGIIFDDDGAAPFLNVDDVILAEGNAGTSTATFTVQLTAPAAGTVTVDFATVDVNATAGGAGLGKNDYVAASGTVTFAPGETTKKVNVTINGDTTDEDDEAFFFVLSNATGGAAIQDGHGYGIITSDDAAPTLTVSGAQAQEGTGATGNSVMFPVYLSKASARTVTVDFSATSDSAEAGVDFSTLSGTVTFAPGVTMAMAQVSTIPDAIYEGAAETFLLTLSHAVNGSLGGASAASGLITEDEQFPPITMTAVSANEGTPAADGRLTTPFSFVVTLVNASSKVVSVDFATQDGTALGTSDYVPVNGTLTIPPGVKTMRVYVSVVKDAAKEANESFQLALSNAKNGGIGTASAAGNIVDDD